MIMISPSRHIGVFRSCGVHGWAERRQLVSIGGGSVFVLISRYTAPLEEIDRLAEAHVEWLRKYVEKNRFVVAGRRSPRVGGVIIATGDDEEEIRAVLAEDPYFQAGAAVYDVFPFMARIRHPILNGLLESD